MGIDDASSGALWSWSLVYRPAFKPKTNNRLEELREMPQMQKVSAVLGQFKGVHLLGGLPLGILLISVSKYVTRIL
jgi:hypothetical protein